MTTPSSPHQMLHPRNWKAPVGYANGVAASGTTLYLGGLIGWNGQQEFETDDFIEQVAQTLQNISDVLEAGNASPEHLVRMTWYITDKRDYLNNLKGIGKAYREIIGNHYPAMAMVQVAALIEDRAKVEIEATAVLPHSAGELG